MRWRYLRRSSRREAEKTLWSAGMDVERCLGARRWVKHERRSKQVDD